MQENQKGLDPNSATGTQGAVDPETGTYGTAGTPLTTPEPASGSTIGTGSAEGEREYREGDFQGSTPDEKRYTTGGEDDDTRKEQPR
jgi:hypothetical protein